MMVDHLHDFRRLPDHDLDAAPPRLLADVGGDRQLPVGSRPDPEVSRIPGDLLGSGQRRVTELILAFLRRAFLPLADPSACDDQVMLIPDAIDGDRAELEFVDVHGLVQFTAGWTRGELDSIARPRSTDVAVSIVSLQ